MIAESSSRVVIVDVGGELSARLGSTQTAGLRDWLLDPGRSVDALQVALTRNVSFIPRQFQNEPVNQLAALAIVFSFPGGKAVGQRNTVTGIVPIRLRS
jgi:hypothetical protein